MKQLLFCLLFPAFGFSQNFSREEVEAYRSEAQQVTIIRDNWGVPHIYGKTDADVVFGLMYSECEENFPRMERNYLEVMGRLAEIDGKNRIFDDLQMQLIYDTSAAKDDYATSPDAFKKLLNAFADGVNYYLSTHPQTHPQVLKRFEAWFPLMYTDGSISATQMGGITLQDTRNLYLTKVIPASALLQKERKFRREEWSGSNGFALGPSKTESGNTILYINPHVTFYFRTEVQLVSEEGLNAYGAVTWGQFFVYQGFNEHCGWMHTSSYSDVADVYEEKIVRKNDSFYYKYDNEWRPVKTKQFIIRYKNENEIVELPLTVYYTHHGPVMGSRDGKWLSLKEHNRSFSALLQSWSRTKANSFEEFKKIMNLRSNNSNNTVYADDKGNIAYWHGNFMPVRNNALDWTLPVDGSASSTEWNGLHTLDQVIHIYNPVSGWIQNCNSTPFTASGESSPLKKDYPAYMAPDGQNTRALNAMRVLTREKKFTLDKVITAGYDHYLSAFGILLPALLDAYKSTEANDPAKKNLAEAISLLQSWNKYSSEQSVATSIAVQWGNLMLVKLPVIKTEEKESDQVALLKLLAKKTPAKEQLAMLATALQQLQSQYGTWRIPWGDINRYQRTTGQVRETFSDTQASLPVGMASAKWGSLPAFESRPFNNSKKLYGYSGNSFIAAIEFGKKLKARTVVTGGQSSDPSSKHFTDQAPLYINGKFKDILFYKEDVMQHVEKTYHPGLE